MVGRLEFLPAAMAARRSAGWDAEGWRGSSRGASIDWCGAAGALGRGEGALYRRVDGEAERAAKEGRRRASVGRSGEGFAPGWSRGCAVWKRAAGSIGERGGADDGCPRRTGAAAAMACGGATSARAGARLGSRRSRAGAGRGEAAWNAKNCSGAVEDGRRGSPHGRPWRRVVQMVLFEEHKKEGKEEEDESKRARECAGLNRRRRIRHGTTGGKR
jgi:hypothetical protein